MYVLSSWRAATGDVTPGGQGYNPPLLPPAPGWWTDLSECGQRALKAHIGTTVWVQVCVLDDETFAETDITPWVAEEGVGDPGWALATSSPQVAYQVSEVEIKLRPDIQGVEQVASILTMAHGDTEGARLMLWLRISGCPDRIGLGRWFVTQLFRGENPVIRADDQLGQLHEKRIYADDYTVPGALYPASTVAYTYDDTISRPIPPTVDIENGLIIHTDRCECGSWKATVTIEYRNVGGTNYWRVLIEGPSTAQYAWMDEIHYTDWVYDAETMTWGPSEEASQCTILPAFWGADPEAWIPGDVIEWKTTRAYRADRDPITGYTPAIRALYRTLTECGVPDEEIDASAALFSGRDELRMPTRAEGDLVGQEAHIMSQLRTALADDAGGMPSDRDPVFGTTWDWMLSTVLLDCHVMLALEGEPKALSAAASIGDHGPVWLVPGFQSGKIRLATLGVQNSNPDYIITSETGLIDAEEEHDSSVKRIRVFFHFDYQDKREYVLQDVYPDRKTLPASAAKVRDGEKGIDCMGWRSAERGSAREVAAHWFLFLSKGIPRIAATMDILYASCLTAGDTYRLLCPERGMTVPRIVTVISAKHDTSTKISKLALLDWSRLDKVPLIFQPPWVEEGMPGSENKWNSGRWII